MTERPCWLYIMINKRNSSLDVGATSDPIHRVAAHKDGRGAAFVNQHDLWTLVYYEEHAGYEEARVRENRVKKERRAWMLALIEGMNPGWRDLYPDLTA